MPQSQDVPSAFPVGGVDVSCEFARQPAATTPDAVNVRSYDTLEARLRGGSRPGLSKWIDERVNGNALIQHLTVLVDPTTLALSASLIPYTVDGTETGPDGKLYREGGSGSQPAVSLLAGDIDLEENPFAGAAPAFVQGEAQGFLGDGEDAEFVFTTNVAVGNTVIFFVCQLAAVAPDSVLVTNANAVELAQAGAERTFTKVSGVTRNARLTMWYRTVAEVADRTCRVSLRPLDEVCVVGGVEYSGVMTTGQLDATGGTDAGNADVMTAGSISPGNTNQLILAAFMACLSPDTVTPGAGFTLRVNHPDGTVDNTDIQLYVVERTDSDFPNAYEPTADFAGGADDYCAAAASFKD